GRRRAHVPGVPGHCPGAAMHRGRWRRPGAGRPADHAAPLRREPGARRPRAHRARRSGGLARARGGGDNAVRALFLVIVLANVAFFIWARYVAPPEAAVDPLPLGRQIEPEKLKVVSPAEVATLNARPPLAAAP